VQNKILKLQVRIEEKNEVKIKLRIKNGDRLLKLDGRRVQKYLEKE